MFGVRIRCLMHMLICDRECGTFAGKSCDVNGQVKTHQNVELPFGYRRSVCRT